jgi:hypothetical protein
MGISLDRPGFGVTEPFTNSSMRVWLTDIVLLTNSLNRPRFSLLGLHSLHSALCILRFAFCALHSALCILRFAFCALHSKQTRFR